MYMRIGVLGSGIVAQTLAVGFKSKGHDVVVGTSNPTKLADWSREEGIGIRSFAETAEFAALLILAVKGSAAMAVLRAAGPQRMLGKTVIDATNPVADAPPVNGVMPFFTGPNESLLELIQAEFQDVHFVKALNSVGYLHFIDPKFDGGPPTMFIAGNEQKAKVEVRGLLAQIGWETADMGAAEAARAIEPLCMLWCIPGFSRNEWMHAFKLLKT